MQQSDIGAIADSVKDCLRCGKCKPVCATHVPRANLLYSPRNKILATSLLVEAFLYEEQTRRGISIKHWEEFEDVADHCTVCHKCLTPVPGEDRLRRRVDEHAQPAAQDGPEELPARQRGGDVVPQRHQPRDHQADARGDGRRRLQGAAPGQRPAARRWRSKQTAAPPATVGTAPIKEQVIHFINKKMPGGLPKKTARALLDIEDKDYVPIIRDPKTTTRRHRGGVLFPRLRLGAPVLAGRPGDAGHAVARRRADGAAAGLPVLRLPAARQRASSTRPRRSSPTTGCCSTAWPTR